jgi:Glycosyl hydrolase family 115
MMKDEAIRRSKRITRGVMQGITAIVLVAGCRTSAWSQFHLAKSESGGPLVLHSGLTILQSPNEPVPIQEATKDLAADFAKVLGTAPRIVTREEDAGPITILIGERSEIPEAMRPTGLTAPESFSISVINASWNRNVSTRVVRLAGADTRGTIYAIYEFSQDYLGIDPMYYWTDRQPLPRTHVELPASLDKAFSPPVFKYRGFFLNDEDLLTGWAPGEKQDKTGISLQVWNKIYETILRLKGNMVVPGTWIFPDDPQVGLVAKRGLILTQHHATPLGMNVARWPKDVPYNYSTHPEILERAWKNAVASYSPQQEILWEIGLRGLSDTSYDSSDPSVKGNDKALGELISKAIADQMRIVRAVHPDAKFATGLWQEGARLVQQGNLTIPPEVITVWADLGYGYLQDDGKVVAGQGAYYHVAMMNSRANQLTEMVPVERIVSELGRYAKAGATEYMLVNTSDIRPVVMTTRAVMDLAWKGALPGAPDAGDQFYRQWATEEFGEKASRAVAEVYKEYFSAPAHYGDDHREYGDQLYHNEAQQMLLTYMTDWPLYYLTNQAPKWALPHFLEPRLYRGVGKDWLRQTVALDIQKCSDAQPRWDAVWKKALAAEPLVDPARLPFYRAQVLAMIAINRDSNRILLLVSKAIQDAQNGETAQAHKAIAQALEAFDDIHQAESKAEYGKWKNWYRGDWLTGIYRTRELVQNFSNFLDDPLAHMSPPLPWTLWEGYYHIMHYEGDRSVDVH